MLDANREGAGLYHFLYSFQHSVNLNVAPVLGKDFANIQVSTQPEKVSIKKCSSDLKVKYKYLLLH